MSQHHGSRGTLRKIDDVQALRKRHMKAGNWAEVARLSAYIEELYARRRKNIAGRNGSEFKGATSKGVVHPGSREVDTIWQDNRKRRADA